ncbi:FHA domain-containing protein [Nocardia macrotermitis]|uniref:FHA domain-containing protein n=1 Tax=Nocardia macrotermitis TaxID=2585198 RepID=A0A7K0DDV7_9NOCA|nr:FHA domain-containing protein [Nocardia macrotermitis]MQY23897.1 hypothetical protein [Nocardia macrotermitis]
MTLTLNSPGVQRFPRTHHNLLKGGRPVAGTISLLSLGDGAIFTPDPGREVLFGRNRPVMDLCVGEDDLRVSRHHGTILRSGTRWIIKNLGGQPIRIADSYLLYQDAEPIPLATGYTPVYIRGSEQREHLLEIFVTGPQRHDPIPKHRDDTDPGVPHHLTDRERLVLVVLGQRYLRQEHHPQPLTRDATAEQLIDLQPDADWKRRRVDTVVTDVRHRLSAWGVDGLDPENMPQPIGNILNHNLIQELMRSGTLSPADLALIEEPEGH